MGYESSRAESAVSQPGVELSSIAPRRDKILKRSTDVSETSKPIIAQQLYALKKTVNRNRHSGAESLIQSMSVF